MASAKNLGCLLTVAVYNGSKQPEIKQKLIYSIKQFEKLLAAIARASIPYGVSWKQNQIIIHVFLDRAFKGDKA